MSSTRSGLPWAISRTACLLMASLAVESMRQARAESSCTNLRQRLHVLDRRMRQNSVAQIKDVARAAVRQAKNVFGALLQLPPTGKQQYRIEIALHRVIDIPPSASPHRAECASQARSLPRPVSAMEGSSVALSVPK